MGKKIWWAFNLRNLFLCDLTPGREKRSKVSRKTSISPSIDQFPENSTLEGTLTEVREEQGKHALDVVRITGLPESSHQHLEGARAIAAVKIQAAFRAYLARKALRALRAVVRLQAIVRGRAVRRQVTGRLRRSPSSTLSVTHEELFSDVKINPKRDHQNQARNRRKETDGRERDCKNEGQWDDSASSREEVESASLKRKEAMIRRERMKWYSFSHQERECAQLGDPFASRKNAMLAYLVKQWTEDEGNRRDKHDSSLPLFISSSRAHHLHHLDEISQLRQRNPLRGYWEAGSIGSSFSRTRRSFGHVRQRSSGDEFISITPPRFRSYMATTESAKAKVVRSPRLLHKGHLNTFFKNDSRYMISKRSSSFQSRTSSDDR